MPQKSTTNVKKQIEAIRSGEGAGLYGFLGFLCSLTFIGAIIAYANSFGFLEDISDKEYLLKADARKINQRKGFYSWACYGNLFVGIACIYQWKADMISVLEGKPSKASLNKHSCFKIWWPIALAASFMRVFVNNK